MLRALWTALGRPLLCGAALLSVVYLLDAQELGTPILRQPTPTVLPALLPDLPTIEPIVPASSEQPAAPTVPVSALQRPTDDGVPTSPRIVSPPAPTTTPDDVKARIERLEKQNQALLEALQGLQKNAAPAPLAAPVENGEGALSTNDVKKIVGDYLAAKETQVKTAETAKKLEQEQQGFTVGKQIGFGGTWTNNQPWFETSDKAFRIHIGGRIQPEWVFGARADTNVATGTGGTGPFLEGFNIRRARLEADGWLYEVVDFFIEYDFANQFTVNNPFRSTAIGTPVATTANNDQNVFGVPAPTDVWAGINYIPWLGGIRIGSFKPVIGLEHLISSRYLDMMERNSAFDTYYNRNNGFAPGFQIFNFTEDQRLTWQFSATKPTNTLFGWSNGGGEWAYTGRVTGLPWYEANGRRMMHLGMGAQYIDHLDNDQANLNTRWLLRQAGPLLQNTVARAVLNGRSQTIVNPELFINLGPLSIMSEYTASWVNGVTSFATPLTGFSTFTATPSRQYFSQSAYVQAMYFLTGEHRPYGKTALHSSGAAPTRVVPNRNYFWVPGEGGSGNPFSCGAWQVGARYCWSDLDDRGINGGTVHEVTIGLNWFLNPNMKVQWNYDIGHREIINATSSGYYQGFGMRMTFDF